MTEQISSLFEKTFQSKPSIIVQAPGRLEILGNHTDYNEGYVLSTAVDSYTSIAFSKSDTGLCHVYSPQVEDKIREVDLSELNSPLPGKDWVNYVRGILFELQKKGCIISPFKAAVTTSIPLSAGMSSSAALEMALLTGLCKLYNFELSLEQKARIGQGCENNYIGANTGLMDQFTSLAGKKDHLVLSEYRDLTIEAVPFSHGLQILVFNSGVKHDLSIEYNERRRQCEEAAVFLHKIYPAVKSLRDISLEVLLKHKADMTDAVFRRALHVVGENDRVNRALQFLKNKQTDEFGQLLFESHQSSIDNFENSCQELDFLVSLARKSPLCLGARLSGGGFGGISIHLIHENAVEEYTEYIRNNFKEKYGTLPGTFICRCAEGAKTVLP